MRDFIKDCKPEEAQPKAQGTGSKRTKPKKKQISLSALFSSASQKSKDPSSKLSSSTTTEDESDDMDIWQFLADQSKKRKVRI